MKISELKERVEPIDEICGTGCHWEMWATVVATMLGFFLRVHHLEDTPPAFSYEEAARALQAMEILQVGHALFSGTMAGVSRLFAYLTAGTFGVLGTRAVVQRLVVAFLSTLTIPLIYRFVRGLFRSLGERRSGVIGTLAALGLATSFWHLFFGRIGLEQCLIPLVMLACFVSLLRGYRSGRAVWFALGGVFLGLGFYVDLAFWAVAVLLGLITVYWWVVVAHHRAAAVREEITGNPHSPLTPTQAVSMDRRHVWLFVLTFGIGAAVICAPLAVYFGMHPSEFMRRGTEAFFLRPDVHHGDPLGALWRGVTASALAFGFTGDSSAAANLPGRPILDVGMAAAFWVGLALSVARFKRPAYAFGVLWWGTMCLAAGLFPDRVPNHARLLAVAPVTYIFPALTIDWVQQMIRKRARHPSRLLVVLAVVVAVIYGLAAGSAYRDYFGRWAGSDAAYAAFNGPDRDLAERINADEPDSVYLLPYDVLWSPQPYAVVEFFHSGGVDYRTIHVNELEVPRQLNGATQDKIRVKLVRMEQGQENFLADNADPKDLLGFYLEQHGRFVGAEHYGGGDILEFALPPDGVDFGLPLQFLRHGVPYDRQLWLESSAMGNASRPTFNQDGYCNPGDTMWLVVQWDVLSPNADDYVAHLRLVDEDGRAVAEIEQRLFDNLHEPTSGWVKRDIPVLDFCMFPVSGDVEPGQYSLMVGIYSPALGEYVTIHGTESETFFGMRDIEIVGVPSTNEGHE